MTTTVKISAHCSNNKEVQVAVTDSMSGNVKDAFTLQDGETAERVVYDDLVIGVRETLKTGE